RGEWAGSPIASGGGLLCSIAGRRSRGVRRPGHVLGRPPATLSVIICTKDRPELLATCLESLRRQTRHPQEIVIVDGSATPSQDAADRLAGTLRGCRVALITSAPGLPHQRNVGTRATTGSVVVY